MEWLASKGAHIYVPVGHSPDVDFIAEVNGRLLRIEVKSCTFLNERGRWDVSIATSGGNQSWSGVVKYFDRARCDYLFVVVGDGRRWFIPATDVEGKAGLALGGTKYSEFEVERGRPISGNVEPGSTIAAEGGRRSRRAGPACKVGAQVLSGFDSHPPHSPPPASSSASESDRVELPPVGRTRMSKHHQVAVPRAVAAASELEPGDRFRVESDGRGRFVMTRIEEYAQRHAAQLQLNPEEAED